MDIAVELLADCTARVDQSVARNTTCPGGLDGIIRWSVYLVGKDFEHKRTLDRQNIANSNTSQAAKLLPLFVACKTS